MTVLARKLVLSAASACFALALGSSAASARVVYVHHHTKHHTSSKAHHASGSSSVRGAQRHLSNLGYYTGSIDGIMGPGTKAAIKQFQREHGLKADGVPGKKTNAALSRADHSVPVTGRGMLMTHEGVGMAPPADTSVNQDFDSSMAMSGRTISTRFGTVSVNEAGAGMGKRYDVNVNGQPILVADGQPSVVGVSQAYSLANEDAVIFTTYSPGDGTCMYRNHVLVLGGSAASKLMDIGNCTRGYEASVDEGSLYITFPEHDDNREVGSTWKLDGDNLSRL